MYSEDLEGFIDGFCQLGVTMNDRIREEVAKIAEEEGENAEEVVKYAEMKMAQSANVIKADVQERLIVPQNVVPKVLKIIDGYNKKARKWGYELLTYNTEISSISGKFTEKTDAEDSKAGFMAEMKEAYKNGDLCEEWKKILKLCNRMDSYIPTH